MNISWSVITCILIVGICVILFFNRPLNLMFFNINSLPMLLATKTTLELLKKENTKENRKYVRSMCCDGYKFTDDFMNYVNGTFGYHNIEFLVIVMYEYINFKEMTKEAHSEDKTT